MENIIKEKNPTNAFSLLQTLISLGIPFVHLIMMLVAYEYSSDSLTDIGILVGSFIVFGGPIFFTCYGIDLARSHTQKNIIKRGVQILIIAIAFNIVRNYPEDILCLYAFDYTADLFLISLFTNDTFIFIGLFTIFYGFIKKYNCPLWLFTLITLILFGVNIYLSNNVLELNTALSVFIGNFVTGYEYCHFAFLGWCIFPCFGIYVNKIIEKKKNKRNAIFGIMIVLAIVAIVVCSKILLANGINPIEILAYYAFYGTYNVFSAILMLSIAIIMLFTTYFIYQLVPENKLENALIKASIYTFPFYLVHFELIYLVVLLPLEIYEACTGIVISITPLAFLVIALAIVGASIIICKKYGFTLSKWLFKITDYSRWFKH